MKLLLAAARREQYGSERWRWLREQLALEELDARVRELGAYSFRSARPEQNLIAARAERLKIGDQL